MEFRDLKRQHEALKEQIDTAILSTVASTQFISGNAVSQLENRLAAYVDRVHCISCANGTDALELMLKAWDIKKGDAVFVPDFTFFATAEAVCSVGATPIFVDVSGDTYNIDVNKLSLAVSAVKKAGFLCPRAIIAVDLFGQPADYNILEDIAKKEGLLLFEDAAQGFGGTYHGRKACSFGDASITSFFPAKPLGCYGDGGAIFTDDDEKASLIRSLTMHGKGSHKYNNVRIGRNSRLDSIQAAILNVKMDAFDGYELNDINKAAKLYTEKLKSLNVKVKIPEIPDNIYSSWAQYTVRLDAESDREKIMEVLKSKGIPSMVYYPVNLTNQLAFNDTKGYQVDDCLVSYSLTQSVLSLPLHPYITDEEVQTVCMALSELIV